MGGVEAARSRWRCGVTARVCKAIVVDDERIFDVDGDVQLFALGVNDRRSRLAEESEVRALRLRSLDAFVERPRRRRERRLR